MNEKDDIFEIRVDENGKRTVSRIYPLMKLVFWLGLAVEIIILVGGAINYFRLRNIRFDITPGYYWYLRIYTAYLIIVSGLMILQSVYFLKFTRQAHESIKINDSFGFNNSFAWVYKSLRIALIAIVINGLFSLYGLFYYNL